MPIRRILTLNSGSSSLKASLYEMGPEETLILSAGLERVGLRGSRFLVQNAAKEILLDDHHDLPDHDAALKALLDWLQRQFPENHLDVVGHRLVHGGPNYSEPHLVDSELLERLEGVVSLAPEHLPHELKAIRYLQQHTPHLRQVACFDTAFHRHMPELAQRFALPRSLWHQGVLRYGFHGLSYEYIVRKLGEVAGAETAQGRLLIAHLGNGASMAAVQGGRSIDTTMGLTPAGGLMMGTRSGDLDPGVLLYLLEEKGRTPAAVDYLVNQLSGLVGVSGSSSDMRDLLGRASDDPHAAQAIEMYCYQARKYLGALATALGGLDTLVFTAGVGANSPPIRERICRGLQFLGICIDPARNAAGEAVISVEGSPVTVRVMKTDEELTIARHCYALIADGQR